MRAYERGTCADCGAPILPGDDVHYPDGDLLCAGCPVTCSTCRDTGWAIEQQCGQDGEYRDVDVRCPEKCGADS